MKTYRLTKEEKEILDAVESGKVKPIPMTAEQREGYRAAARETLRRMKSDRVTIQIPIPAHDFEQLKSKAAKRGVSYQRHAASILHRYV